MAALNHNANAIATHAVNFRQTQHFLADIFKQSESAIPRAQLAWFSPSCVFHSVARGGQHCNEQERAHAEQMPRFCFAMNVQCVMVENVMEFVKWGPLKVKRDKLGQPVTRINQQGELETVLVPDKDRQGEYYQDWVRIMKSMGYVNYEFRFLNAADYGTPQSRVRYFGIFTRRGMPIVWPKATHDQMGRNGLPKWRGVRECLDLKDHGHSIFTRVARGKKPLSDKTLRRIMAGLAKHVVGSNGPEQNFLTHYYSGGGQTSSVGAPCPAVTTNPKARLIYTKFLAQYNGGSDAARCLSLDSPANTLTTENRFAVVTSLLYQNNGTRPHDEDGRMTRPLDVPAPTLTTNGGNQFLMTYYRHGGTRSLNQPAATLTTKDRIAKIKAEGFLFSQQFSNQPRSLDAPARTMVASRRHQYLLQVARTSPQLQPQPGDTATMQELKDYCRQHGIADLLLRMLKVSELKLIQGFSADYHLGGTTTEQKAMIGNAVCPAVSEALARSMMPTLNKWRGVKQVPLRKAVVQRWEQGSLFANAGRSHAS